MIKEITDRETGAILFKKDADTLRSEEMHELLKTLETRVTKLEKAIKKLSK